MNKRNIFCIPALLSLLLLFLSGCAGHHTPTPEEIAAAEPDDPSCAYFYFSWGRFAEMAGRLEEAEDAYTKALEAPDEKEKAKWFGRCQEIIADDAVNGFLFSAPSLPVLKADVMGWWENYPTIALDCTAVWWKP